jgi:hypothetical protein
MCGRWTGYYRGALMKVLDKVFREEDIQGPIESDTQLLLEPGEFEKVNGSPEPPGGKSGKIDAKNSGDAGAPAD